MAWSSVDNLCGRDLGCKFELEVTPTLEVFFPLLFLFILFLCLVPWQVFLSGDGDGVDFNCGPQPKVKKISHYTSHLEWTLIIDFYLIAQQGHQNQSSYFSGLANAIGQKWLWVLVLCWLLWCLISFRFWFGNCLLSWKLS